MYSSFSIQHSVIVGMRMEHDLAEKACRGWNPASKRRSKSFGGSYRDFENAPFRHRLHRSEFGLAGKSERFKMKIHGEIIMNLSKITTEKYSKTSSQKTKLFQYAEGTSGKAGKLRQDDSQLFGILTKRPLDEMGTSTGRNGAAPSQRALAVGRRRIGGTRNQSGGNRPY
jgi:hypothetical protein